jgi:predicted ATPase/DNA-binding CsgD family transcriptional regulator
MPDPADLPQQFSSFVGRDREVGELRELLRTARAVTLCGAAGIGKTRLALHLLAAVAAEFPDGVWFVELAELRQPELVVARVAAAAGVDEEPGRPLPDTLADALRHRRALLALDNCEHLVEACASLCQRVLAGAPGLQVVATSREPLRVAAEAVWQVPPLALPPPAAGDPAELACYDAIRLFAERAAAVAPGFSVGPGNAASVRAVCEALDGLPLGIELAAARVPVLAVEQIAARLDDRFTLLTSGARTAAARHQTLRAAIDWSHDLLSEPERVMLRRLSVFTGWSLGMAEEVCADEKLPAPRILDLITALADKSLLEVEPEALGEARYRMLHTIREYASSCLALAGEDRELRARRREYTLRVTEKLLAVGMATVRAPWSARIDVFRRFDLEEDNLREVLGSCLADGDAEAGLRICTAARPCWIVRGTFAEGERWMDAFLELATADTVPSSVLGPALVGRAQLAVATGSAGADEQAMAGLELCWESGQQYWAATALNLLTEIALHAGRLDEAFTRGGETLSVARSAGDRWNEGYALGTCAAVAARQGNLREAQQLAEAALAVMRDIEQLWGGARAMLGLADLARLRADPATATDYYTEALGILRQVNARPEIARCLAGLGRIAIDRGELGAARVHLADSLRLSYQTGSRIGIARGLEALAKLAVLEGHPDTGLRLAGAVSALRRDAHLPPVPGSRTQRYLDAASPLGEHVVARLWAEGTAMTPAAAVNLALGEPDTGAPDTGLPQAVTGLPSARAGDALTGGLTSRERQVVALIAAGKSNREIAAELFISPATAARHVANILAKLGYSSRSQVAVWAKTGHRRAPPDG